MKRGIDIDQVIAEQARRAGGDLSAAPERRIRDTGPILCSGKSLAPMRDLVLVKVRPSLAMIGGLHVTDVTLSTRNQQHRRAKVVARGPKAEEALVGCTVVVSEYFGDEIVMTEREVEMKVGKAYHMLPRKQESFRLGRERDIVAIESARNTFPLFALGDRMLLERIPAPTMAGDLYLPDDAQEMQFKAKVISHGSKCTVVCGDTVLVPKADSVVVRIDGQEYYWINEQALLGIL